jgi:hypothetical protein
MKKTKNILWDVPFRNQLGDQWCWAACMQMVFNYYEPDKAIQQCTIVAKHLSKTMNKTLTCTDVFDKNTQSAKNDFDITTDLMLLNFNKYTIKGLTETKLYWQTIKREIDSGRPLIANQTSHYIVIFGYIDDKQGEYFIFHNPGPDNHGFGIRKFASCEKINIEAELLCIDFKAVIQKPAFLNLEVLKKRRNRAENSKIRKLKAFFDENAIEATNEQSIKLVTKIINITKDKTGQATLGTPPVRYEEILANKVIGTFELCEKSGVWQKIKAKIDDVSENLIRQITVNNKKIKLLNTNFDPNEHPSILPIDEARSETQFEKIIFQPTVYRFYHIKMSDVDDQLTPLLNYTIDGVSFKQKIGYPFNFVLEKITNELDKKLH